MHHQRFSIRQASGKSLPVPAVQPVDFGRTRGSGRVWTEPAWVIRLILLIPAILFATIGLRFLIHPEVYAAARGIAFVSPVGMTIARVGFGAFPLGCAVFLLFCMPSEHRLLSGLSLVAILDGTVLIIRTFGMMADSTVRENMRLLYPELALMALTVTGISLERANRQRIQRNQRGIQ